MQRTGLWAMAMVAASLAPLSAQDARVFEISGEDARRGPFQGQLRLVGPPERLRVERQVHYLRSGERELLAGDGSQRGPEVRATLQPKRGAAGALLGVEEEGGIRFRFRVNPDGSCRSQCRTGGRTFSDARGRASDAPAGAAWRPTAKIPALPASAPRADAPKESPRIGAIDQPLGLDVPLGPGVESGRPKLDDEDVAGWMRFEGVPFVLGAGDALDIDPSDPQQGGLGDCYLISAMIALAKTHPELIRAAITERDDGDYEVVLHGVRAFWRDATIVIDDEYPYREVGGNPVPAYAQFGDQETIEETTFYELWPMMIEKAWAQHRGSYQNIVGGHSSKAFAFLTGKRGVSHWAALRSAAGLGQLIEDELEAGRPVCVGTKQELGDLGEELNLVGNHAYVVWEMEDGSFRLYNPWGSTHPTRPLTAEELKQLINNVYVGQI